MNITEKDLTQNKLTLAFNDSELEKEFKTSYDKSVRLPLRFGIIISIISWYSAIGLIYAIIPQDFVWLSTLTVLFIGSYFGFVFYATFKERFAGYYHLLGAISNAWAGLYAIYFCDQFPNGGVLVLPVLIFIIFFGSYMVRLRWIAGFVTALIYSITYQVYILETANFSSEEIYFYAFVIWMVLVFAIFAGRIAEKNNRIAFVQRKTIHAQSLIIEREKELLLKEVHHRVHNNLQIIVSLINLHISKISHAEVERNLKEVQLRILSMALVHKRIKHTSNFIEISVNEYAEHLIESLELEFEQVKLDYTTDIPVNYFVDIDTAISIGMIMNEMITSFFTNALDESREHNEFSLVITQDEKGRGKMTFKDNSTVLKNISDSNAAENLSIELIDALASQLDGHFKFQHDNGAFYEVSF